jgi:hypothetical protein
MLAHLSFVDTRGGCGIVLIVSPRRMMEVDDEIAVVRNDRPVEGNRSDAAPIPQGAPLPEERAVRLAIIGDLDVEGERALRPGVAAVVAGASGATIREWKIDRTHYVATPIMSDGSEGSPLELRGLFEQFLRDAG